MFSLLLIWFFSFCRLLCRPPRQKVVGDQSCEEVRCHASVPPKHQAQRLRQHKQAEHINGRPVIQHHAILLRGAHHSKKVDERHRRVEGQLHHDAEGKGDVHTLDSFWVGHVIEGCQKHPLNSWIICFSATLTWTCFLQPSRQKCDGWSDKEANLDFWSLITAVLSNIIHAAVSRLFSVHGKYYSWENSDFTL